MIKCFNCEYGKTTYAYEKDRATGKKELTPYKVVCGKPSYGRRKYDVKWKSDCSSFVKRERQGADNQGV